jgi:Uncharacterized protein conserved in bacteria (DUF2188)
MSAHKRSLIQPPEEGSIPKEQLKVVVKSVVEGVHLVPDEQGWVVRKSGKERIKTHFSSEEEAHQFAEKLSQQEQVQLFVHNAPVQSFNK